MPIGCPPVTARMTSVRSPRESVTVSRVGGAGGGDATGAEDGDADGAGDGVAGDAEGTLAGADAADGLAMLVGAAAMGWQERRASWAAARGAGVPSRNDAAASVATAARHAREPVTIARERRVAGADRGRPAIERLMRPFARIRSTCS
jgi:hypothetical protein